MCLGSQGCSTDVTLHGRGVGACTAQDASSLSLPCRSLSALEGFVVPGTGFYWGQIPRWVCSDTGITVDWVELLFFTAKTRSLRVKWEQGWLLLTNFFLDQSLSQCCLLCFDMLDFFFMSSQDSPNASLFKANSRSGKNWSSSSAHIQTTSFFPHCCCENTFLSQLPMTRNDFFLSNPWLPLLCIFFKTAEM